ncbi:MAG: 3-oxoacyl-[acyl-carrier-protein] reductase [Cuniculiplasma sp. C_DKE]|nr:MAG: 3-oxoacyl-[acyl-carrier-protein] reductase [Cuniculiplasma sp. C_DKE]
MTYMSGNSKIAVITGGNGGIGKSIAKSLLRDKFSVILGDLKNEVVDTAREISQEMSGEILGMKVDVTDFLSTVEFFKNIKEQMPYGKVSVLINNAGITRDSTIRKMTYEQWDQVMKVNLYGAFNCTKQVVEDMIGNNFGRIINISSISRYGNRGQANYAASKSGLVGLTLTLARELGKYGITSNAISPGIINTEMIATIPADILKDYEKKIPAGRLGTPEEVAEVISFLCSDKASYINGEIINVNGGFFF